MNTIQEEISNSAFRGFSDNTDSTGLPLLTVNVSNNPSPGNLYLSNFPYLEIPFTPYLLTTDNADISYYKEMNNYALDFKKQPNGLLTYNIDHAFYAMNENHVLVDSFRCGNGYPTDEHELKIMNNGDSADFNRLRPSDYEYESGGSGRKSKCHCNRTYNTGA